MALIKNTSNENRCSIGQFMFATFWLFFGGFHFISHHANAESLVEASYTGSSEKPSVLAAKNEIFKNAKNKISMKYVRQIIGEDKTLSQKGIIEAKIVRQSSKYILFSKGGPLKTTGESRSMQVQMKLSLKNLRDLLLAEGLLYRLNGPPKVIPMIKWSDRTESKQLLWWTGESSDVLLRGFGIDLHRQLKDQLLPKGFYVLAPIAGKTFKMLPDYMKVENPRKADYLELASYFQGAIVLKGGVHIFAEPQDVDFFRIYIKVEALHTNNGRVIAEVTRNFKTEKGPKQQVVANKMREVQTQVAQDLTAQLHAAWKTGTFGASLVQMRLKGALNYSQLKQFKAMMLAEMHDVKSMRERLFEPSQTTFELDSSASPKGLAKSIAKRKFPRFKVEIGHVGDDSLDLEVTPL